MANRYSNIETIIKTGKGKVYDSVLFPHIELSDSDIVVMSKQGDRLDLLANEYYNDSSLWWVIAIKNNLTDVDLTLKEGLILRIPTRNEALQIESSLK